MGTSEAILGCSMEIAEGAVRLAKSGSQGGPNMRQCETVVELVYVARMKAPKAANESDVFTLRGCVYTARWMLLSNLSLK